MSDNFSAQSFPNNFAYNIVSNNAGSPGQYRYDSNPNLPRGQVHAAPGYQTMNYPPLDSNPQKSYPSVHDTKRIDPAFNQAPFPHGSQHTKISSAQMPSVVAVQESDQSNYLTREQVYRTSFTENIPPLPTTAATIIDDGNCSPRFVRSTMYQIPTHEDLAHSCKIPSALIIQPFAQKGHNEAEIPLVDFGTAGPIRCSRCRAYINLFVKFIKGGTQFICNICSMVNDVPDYYFSNLDAYGKRTDLSQRSELACGSVDYVASKEYVIKKPSSPYIIFAIECSRNSIQNGSFLAALSSLRALVQAHLDQPAMRIYERMAIITFDKNIYTYDLRSSEPQILIMSDINDPFVPLHDGLFFDPLQCHEQLYLLLDRLPTFFGESRIVDSCFGSVVLFCYEALKEHGGRAVLFNTSISGIGLGGLKFRESSSSPSSDKVDNLLHPQTDFYTKLGHQACLSGVAFSIVATPLSYIDVATIGQLAVTTSGTILSYPNFNYERDTKTLISDIYSYLTKPFVFDAILRVRAGSSLQVSEYYGNFTTINQTDYYFASLDCDQTFAVTYIYDSKLEENEVVTFQCAILYTSSTGQRRIRVHNLGLKATSLISNIFRLADNDAVVQYFCKKSLSQISSVPIPTIVNQFQIRSAQLLAAYRRNCAQNMPSGQLVLPESFKLLPMYCLAFSKSTAFSLSNCSVDVRMTKIYSMMNIAMWRLPMLLYPQMYEVPFWDISQHPARLRLSKEFIRVEGMMVGKSSYGSGRKFRQSSHPKSLRWLVTNHVRSPTIKLIGGVNDPAEHEINSLLIEDGDAIRGVSYVDFLCKIHSLINHELSSSSIAERNAFLGFLQ